MKKLFLLLVLSSIFSIGKAEVLYLKNMNHSIEFGQYTEDNKKVKINAYNRENLDHLMSEIQKGEEQKILYYIHCFHGGFRPYHKNSIAKLKEIEGFDKIICIEWNARKVLYKKAWQYAGTQGENFGDIMDFLLSKNTNSILCHSMGNRYFEGITTKLSSQSKVEKIILAAPDLSMNSFQNGELFNSFEVKEIIVLVNKKDSVLKYSKFTHQQKRLGLNGADEDFFSMIYPSKKIILWDVTRLVKEGEIGGAHTYFKRTETVFNRIKGVLEV